MADKTVKLQILGPLGTQLPAPETAVVGQLLRVAAVDENGKITAMEAVNSAIIVPVTQAEYDALVEAGTEEAGVLYAITEDGEGT